MAHKKYSKYRVSKAILIPPRDAFPPAPDEVWTATGKQLTTCPAVVEKVEHNDKSNEWFAEEMDKRNLSCYTIANAIGVSAASVYGWKRGTHRMKPEFEQKAKTWFSEHPVGEDAGEVTNKEVEKVNEEKVNEEKVEKKPDYKGDPIRVARKKALQMRPDDWSDAKVVAFLAGVDAMEDAIMEELY